MEDASMARADAGDGGQEDERIDYSCIRLRRLSALDPGLTSALLVLFTAETCDEQIPVPRCQPGEDPDDSRAGCLDIGDANSDPGVFVLSEDGKRLSSEADPRILPAKGLRIYVTLLLDISGSTADNRNEVIAGTQAFVKRLLGEEDGSGGLAELLGDEDAADQVWIGIELFDGREAPVLWQAPTPDVALLNRRLADLEQVTAQDNSTNLNGAIKAAIADSLARQSLTVTRNEDGVVTVGYLVAFTDGADQASRVTREQARTAVMRGRESSDSLRSATVSTFAVMLEGQDFTPEAQADLEYILGGQAAAVEDEPAVTEPDPTPSDPTGLCTDLCEHSNDGSCDDGGEGASFNSCALGTDCSDCGVRPLPGLSPPEQDPSSEEPDTSETSTASAPPQVEFVFNAANADELAQRFDELADRIVKQLLSTYLLAYCSPARSANDHVLEVNLSPDVSSDPNFSSVPLTFNFNSAGFEGGCTADFFETACENLGCGGLNCGACDDSTQVCQEGICVDSCEDGLSCSTNSAATVIVNDLGYQRVCEPGVDVAELRNTCSSMCVDLESNAAHCGSCDHACPSGESCSEGVCTGIGELTWCAGAYVALLSDEQHCGICGHECPDDMVCANGTCSGDATTSCSGSAYCNGCVDVMGSSSTHCGGCYRGCQGTSAACNAGVCECGDLAYEACDQGSEVVCVDTQTSAAHCGVCGNACPTGSTCEAGTCTDCPAGQVECNGACVALDGTDSGNCGACGNACPQNAQCAAGECACTGGREECGGECVDTRTDRLNCGGCGVRCAANETCNNVDGTGVCQCSGSTCDEVCVDTTANTFHCGACNRLCEVGECCSNSSCVTCATGSRSSPSTGNGSVPLDPATEECSDERYPEQCYDEEQGEYFCVNTETHTEHCGYCNNACPPAWLCTQGECLDPGFMFP